MRYFEIKKLATDEVVAIVPDTVLILGQMMMPPKLAGATPQFVPAFVVGQMAYPQELFYIEESPAGMDKVLGKPREINQDG